MGQEDAALLAADALGVLSARLDQTTPHTPPCPVCQCQPSGTYIQLPSHGIAFCLFERQSCAVPSRPCLLCLWLRMCPYLCLGPCAADHNAVRRRRLPHMYASCAALQHDTPRAARLGRVDRSGDCKHAAGTWTEEQQFLCLAPVRPVPVPEPHIEQKKWALHSSTAPHADDASAGTIAVSLGEGWLRCGAGTARLRSWVLPFLFQRAFWPYRREYDAETHSGPGPFCRTSSSSLMCKPAIAIGLPTSSHDP